LPSVVDDRALLGRETPLSGGCCCATRASSLQHNIARLTSYKRGAAVYLVGTQRTAAEPSGGCERLCALYAACERAMPL
jgi:hypothetical protein